MNQYFRNEKAGLLCFLSKSVHRLDASATHGRDDTSGQRYQAEWLAVLLPASEV